MGYCEVATHGYGDCCLRGRCDGKPETRHVTRYSAHAEQAWCEGCTWGHRAETREMALRARLAHES